MNPPELFESVAPGSGQYSFKRDLRLNAWLLVSALVFVGQLALLRHHPEWPPLARGLIALTPLLPALLYVRSWVRFVRGLDELQRRVQMAAHLFAAWGTIVIGVALSILNAQGTIHFLPHGLGFGGVMVLFFPLWLTGVAIASCRYK